jgi:hypothetical protein
MTSIANQTKRIAKVASDDIATPRFKLLTAGNPKTAKGEGHGYLTFILHLAPAKLSGFQVCPMATKGCAAACLNTAGRGGVAKGVARLTVEMIEGGKVNDIQRARIRRTRAFFEQREVFMNTLRLDIEKAIRFSREHGFVPVFRLNGTSDIRWESVRCGEHANIMAAFPDVQFYDYTKLTNRRNVPRNYHLTFSLADGNDESARLALASGMSVAAVFRNRETVERYIETGASFRYRDSAGKFRALDVPVVNGDQTDLRFLDPKGAIVALYAKGNARADRSGFVRD